MNHCEQYLQDIRIISLQLAPTSIQKLAEELGTITGRLFVLGLGGSAANASHAVNDFRKLCGIEAYCPSDNVAELTAIANDEGWKYIYRNWLNESLLCSHDALFILSVGGGTTEVSTPLVEAIEYARLKGARIFGIVGRDGGYTRQYGNCVIVIPTVNEKLVTPYTEAFQSVILHCLVSHPDLQKSPTKW